MKKIISLITSVMIGAALCVSAHAESYGSVTILGDSIATGYGLEGYISGDNGSAADSFGSLLSKSCSEYSNFAVDGRTSAELLKAMDTEEISDAMSGADSVIISIGGNDFLRPMGEALQNAVMNDPDLMESITGASEADLEALMLQMTELIKQAVDAVDISSTRDNISEILGKIRAVNPDGSVYILTVYNPFEGVPSMEALDELASEKLDELNGAIIEAAPEYGAQVVYINSAFAGHAMEYTNILTMDIHPNKAGHSVIYSELTEVMQPSQEVLAPADNAADDTSGGNTSDKTSPDTGAAGIACAAGIAVIALSTAVLTKKKH